MGQPSKKERSRRQKMKKYHRGIPNHKNYDFKEDPRVFCEECGRKISKYEYKKGHGLCERCRVKK